jgi:hypothetical protein
MTDARSALEQTVIIECKGGFTISIQRRLLVDKSSLFTRQLTHCKRHIASGLRVLQINLPRRSLKRYVLWLYGSSEYATFDPSLTAAELFLGLNNLHIAAGILQDEDFGNDMMDAMITHLVGRSNEMPLEDFLVEFLQTNVKGSAGRKLIADWVVWSNLAPDLKFEGFLREIQDTDFCYAVAKAVLRKTVKEWEGDFVPPHMVSPCFYHTPSDAPKLGCSAKREV